MCKSALQNVQPYQKKEIMFIDLVRACGLWLPIRAGREASEKSGKERFKGWSLGTKSPTTNPPLPGSRALRKGSGCLPVRALSLLPELRGSPKSMVKGPEWVALFGWACGSSLVGYQSLHYVNGKLYLTLGKKEVKKAE